MAITVENYFSIGMGCIKELDMFQFFHASLDAITKTFIDGESLRLKKYKLERRKVILPYEKLDSVDKFNNTELPPKKAFRSKLKQVDITDKKYQQALGVFWNEGGCNTIKDYMMVYLKTVLLSVDVFKCLELCV